MIAVDGKVARPPNCSLPGGQLMVAVKANQPTLFAQLKALPWVQVPVGVQTRETSYGRKETS